MKLVLFTILGFAALITVSGKGQKNGDVTHDTAYDSIIAKYYKTDPFFYHKLLTNESTEKRQRTIRMRKKPVRMHIKKGEDEDRTKSNQETNRVKSIKMLLRSKYKNFKKHNKKNSKVQKPTRIESNYDAKEDGIGEDNTAERRQSFSELISKREKKSDQKMKKSDKGARKKKAKKDEDFILPKEDQEELDEHDDSMIDKNVVFTGDPGAPRSKSYFDIMKDFFNEPEINIFPKHYRPPSPASKTQRLPNTLPDYEVLKESVEEERHNKKRIKFDDEENVDHTKEPLQFKRQIPTTPTYHPYAEPLSHFNPLDDDHSDELIETFSPEVAPPTRSQQQQTVTLPHHGSQEFVDIPKLNSGIELILPEEPEDFSISEFEPYEYEDDIPSTTDGNSFDDNESFYHEDPNKGHFETLSPPTRPVKKETLETLPYLPQPPQFSEFDPPIPRPHFGIVPFDKLEIHGPIVPKEHRSATSTYEHSPVLPERKPVGPRNFGFNELLESPVFEEVHEQSHGNTYPQPEPRPQAHHESRQHNRPRSYYGSKVVEEEPLPYLPPPAEIVMAAKNFRMPRFESRLPFRRSLFSSSGDDPLFESAPIKLSSRSFNRDEREISSDFMSLIRPTKAVPMIQRKAERQPSFMDLFEKQSNEDGFDINDGDEIDRENNKISSRKSSSSSYAPQISNQKAVEMPRPDVFFKGLERPRPFGGLDTFIQKSRKLDDTTDDEADPIIVESHNSVSSAPVYIPNDQYVHEPILKHRQQPRNLHSRSIEDSEEETEVLPPPKVAERRSFEVGNEVNLEEKRGRALRFSEPESLHLEEPHQFIEVKNHDVFQAGHNRGHKYHHIQDLQKRHGPVHRQEVSWLDHDSGYGKHYYELNHVDSNYHEEY